MISQNYHDHHYTHMQRVLTPSFLAELKPFATFRSDNTSTGVANFSASILLHKLTIFDPDPEIKIATRVILEVYL